MYLYVISFYNNLSFSCIMNWTNKVLISSMCWVSSGSSNHDSLHLYLFSPSPSNPIYTSSSTTLSACFFPSCIQYVYLIISNLFFFFVMCRRYLNYLSSSEYKRSFFSLKLSRYTQVPSTISVEHFFYEEFSYSFVKRLPGFTALLHRNYATFAWFLT